MLAVRPAVAAPVASADPQQNDVRQQQAWRDALVQAQTLWNAGSHDAAIDLLQQALESVQRAIVSNPKQAVPLLLPMVRELAREQLAQGRPDAVYEMLVRLEPQLGKDADIWALRANAAQRVGLHQECVDAYRVALQSRPREQRWLLGTAVSLLALGDVAKATEAAQRARALGPITKDVLDYLRQAGVVLKDDVKAPEGKAPEGKATP